MSKAFPRRRNRLIIRAQSRVIQNIINQKLILPLKPHTKRITPLISNSIVENTKEGNFQRIIKLDKNPLTIMRKITGMNSKILPKVHKKSLSTKRRRKNLKRIIKRKMIIKRRKQPLNLQS
jgi:hypothetical protein